MAKRAAPEISYSGAPNMISGTTWFYETKKGLCFCTEARLPNGEFLKAVQFTLSWRKVTAAAEKHKAVRATAAKPPTQRSLR